MKTPIDKERAKKQTLKIYIITGIIGFVIIFDAYFQAMNVMKENRRIGFFDALDQGFSNILLKPFGFLPISGNDFVTFISIVAMAGMLGVMYAATAKLRKHDNPETVNGEAHLMTAEELKEYNKRFVAPFGTVDINGKGNMILTKDIRLAIDNKGTKRNCNILTIGGSGAGKTRYFAGPNILQANCNYVITDPSGELLRDYGKFLEDEGYDVKVFNITDPYMSNHYNPFEYIKEEKDVFTLVEAFIRNTTPEGKNGGDPFWENSEKLLLTALILYLWHEAPKEDQTFTKVVQLISLADIDENGDTSAPSPLDLLFEDLEKEDPENLAVQQYKKFKLGAGKTLKSILISVGVRMQAFDLSDIKYLTNTDDFDLYSMGDTKKAIFVIIPTADKTFNFLVSMFYSQIFSVLYSYCEMNAKYGWRVATADDDLVVFHAKNDEDSLVAKKKAIAYKNDIIKGCTIKYDKQKKLYAVVTKNKKNLIGWRGTKQAAVNFMNTLKNLKVEPYNSKGLRHHVRFILDEFANIGQIPAFNEKLATMRKYEISCSIILQALSQLKGLYKDDYNTIVANCDTVLFLGSADMETIKWIIEKLAKKTTTVENTSWGSGKSGGNTSYNKSSIELLTADQIQMMDDTEALVCIRGVRPFYGRKYDLLQHPRFKESDKSAGTFYIPRTSNGGVTRLSERRKQQKENAPVVPQAVHQPKVPNPVKNDAQKSVEEPMIPDFDILNNPQAAEKVKKATNQARKVDAFEAKRSIDKIDVMNDAKKAVENFGDELLAELGITDGAPDTQIKEAIETLIDLTFGKENEEISYLETY